MAISYINSASGTTTATNPGNAIGDMFVVYNLRDGSGTLPGAGTGFTTPTNGTSVANSAASRLSYRIATAANETIPTFANSTTTVLHIYRGTSLTAGNAAVAVNVGTTVSYPALTLVNGNSWVVGMAGHRSVDTALGTAPTGMTNRINPVDATDEAAGHDTNGLVSSWSLQTVAVGGTSSGWVGFTFEIYESTSAPVARNLLLLGVGQ